MKKLTNKKGFTLAELLIVVAIVAVLVAISIPIFSGKLLKAKIATNQANIRAAKAAAVADYLTDGTVDGKKVYYEYDIDNGKAVKKTEGTSDALTADNGVYKKIWVEINGQDVKTKPHAKSGIANASDLDSAFDNAAYGTNGQ